MSFVITEPYVSNASIIVIFSMIQATFASSAQLPWITVLLVMGRLSVPVVSQLSILWILTALVLSAKLQFPIV